jgi:hypothetical protein
MFIGTQFSNLYTLVDTNWMIELSIFRLLGQCTGYLFFFFSLSLVGSVQGLFSCFPLSLRFPPASHVEGLSLTTSLRYQDLRSFFVIS